VTKFAHQRFEPMGMTTNADIPFAKSLVDYIFRWLGMQFIPGYREVNAPRRPSASDSPSAATGHSTITVTDAARGGASTAASSKEEPGCTTGSNGGASAWAVRRESAIAAAEASHAGAAPASMKAASPSGVARVSSTHTVASISETRTTDGRVVEAYASVERTVRTAAANALDQSNAALMGDAPACDGCGSITVRNGTCYRCLNCGNSMGCS
jgi:ribonucleoside-diphosphate reductase alpha chain